jgi:hypothetical protein
MRDGSLRRILSTNGHLAAKTAASVTDAGDELDPGFQSLISNSFPANLQLLVRPAAKRC